MPTPPTAVAARVRSPCAGSPHTISVGAGGLGSVAATSPSGRICSMCQRVRACRLFRLPANPKIMRHVDSAPSPGTRPGGLAPARKIGPPRPCRAILRVRNLGNRAIRESPTPGFRHCHGSGLPRVPSGLSGRSCRPSGVAEPGHPASRGVPGRIVHPSVRCCGRRPCARRCSVPDCLRSAWTETSGARKRRNGLRGQCSGTIILRAYSEMRAEP